MTHDDQLLAQLAQHPGWEVLEKRFLEKRDQYFVNLGRQIQGNRTEPLDQRVIDEKRGFWLGGVWLLKEAKSAKATFERENEKGDSN